VSFPPVRIAIVFSVLAAAAGFAALGVALSNSSGAPPGTVEVTASGRATGAPDTLTVQLAVTTRAKSAAQALNTNDREAHRLEAVFIGAGVRAKDITTSNLSTSPTFNPNGSKIVGYLAEDDLTVVLHGLRKAGSVIAAAQNAVGNDVAINSLAYSLSNSASLKRTARINAMHNAIAQARDLVGGAGEHLGAVRRISTVNETTPVPLPYNASAAAGSTKTVPVPLREGTSTVTVSVDVVFALS
jgi:uncharacterized protein YggE